MLQITKLSRRASTAVGRAPYGLMAGFGKRLKSKPYSGIGLEVPDDVCGTNDGILAGGSDRRDCIEVAVEGRRVDRVVISYLGTELDLRRQPVLPADAKVHIAGFHSGAL